ncbi:hypothetical protein Tco_1343244 [Tanacetum coccineum]
MLVAGVGPLSGKGPRVIVSADASVLPRSVFVRGDATGAALKILTCVFEISGAWPFITSLKCALTQELLDAICAKYFVPGEVHPQLPSPDSTMHERPAEMDLNAFIRIADPRKVRIVERDKAENERPIVTVAKHRTVTLLPTLVVRSSRELSASVEREFIRDASVGDGVDQGFDSVGGQDNVEPTGTPAASHPPKRLRADYGTTGGSATRGKSPSVLNRSSKVVVLRILLITQTLNLEDPEVDSPAFVIPADVSKDKSALHPSVFGSFSSSEKTDRTLSLFTGRSGSGFAAGSIRVEEVVGAGLEEIYVPEWTVTKGFELMYGLLCANMIAHLTPSVLQNLFAGNGAISITNNYFTEFNVSACTQFQFELLRWLECCAEYNILEKR